MTKLAGGNFGEGAFVVVGLRRVESSVSAVSAAVGQPWCSTRFSAAAKRHKAVGTGAIKACVLVLLGMISGCATMTADECLYADWRAIGYEDGAEGQALAYLSNHRQACAEVGVTPDFNAYRGGREEGIRVFCRPANGYRLGSDGHVYQNVCPRDMEDEFLLAYREGFTIHELELAVSEIELRLVAVDYSIEDTEERIADAYQTLEYDQTITNEHRARIRENIDLLTRDVRRMEAEQAQLLVELGVRKGRLHERLNAGR